MRECSVKATAGLQSHALCRKLSLSLFLSLCPLLCGKNRSADLSVQLFFMLLTFTWISPGAVALGSLLAFLCLNVCVSVCGFKHARVCTLFWECVHACLHVNQGCFISFPLNSAFNKSGILVSHWYFQPLWWGGYYLAVTGGVAFVKPPIKPTLQDQKYVDMARLMSLGLVGSLANMKTKLAS